MTVRPSYAVGDWFGVPLPSGGFSLGVVARRNRGILLGYFFGPRRPRLPVLDDAAGLRPDQALLVGRFGHLGLRGGTWPILGRLPDWDPNEWPMPVFIRHEELTGRTLRVFYDPDDPNSRPREEAVRAGDQAQGPADDLMGHGFVETRLDRLLRPGAPAPATRT